MTISDQLADELVEALLNIYNSVSRSDATARQILPLLSSLTADIAKHKAAQERIRRELEEKLAR